MKVREFVKLTLEEPKWNALNALVIMILLIASVVEEVPVVVRVVSFYVLAGW